MNEKYKVSFYKSQYPVSELWTLITNEQYYLFQ